MKKDTDFSHLMGWFVACIATACAVVALSFSGLTDGGRLGRFIYDYQTLMTGFLATGAAFVTVHFLRRQIDTAQVQARDRFMIDLRRTRALALQGIEAASVLASFKLCLDIQAGAFTSSKAFEAVKGLLGDLHEAIEDDVFQMVEREINFPTIRNSTDLISSVRRLYIDRASLLEKEMLDRQEAEIMAREWSELVDKCDLYASEISRICHDFAREYETLLDRYR